MQQIEGVFGDSGGRGSADRPTPAAAAAVQPPAVGPDAARLSQLVMEGNALFRRLNKNVVSCIRGRSLAAVCGGIAGEMQSAIVCAWITCFCWLSCSNGREKIEVDKLIL